MILETKGCFGRQARYRNGPFPVLRTMHPATGQFLQLPSTAYSHNLRQYLFAPSVTGVQADRQLPEWVRGLVPARSASQVQVVSVDCGARLVVRLISKDDAKPATMHQLADGLWLVERSKKVVEEATALNAALLNCGQYIKGHLGEELAEHTAIVADALTSAGTTTFGELTEYLSPRHKHPETRVRAAVVICRLLLGKKLSLRFVGNHLADGTQIQWGGRGYGFEPPMPPKRMAKSGEGA